jgi:acetylornithine deacetylase
VNASRVLEIAQELIQFNSVSSQSNVAISQYVETHLQQLGFDVERVEYVDDNQMMKVNLVARRGTGLGGIVYSGHTDVVPVDDWQSGPAAAFQPKIENDRLYGRGACDMKGSVAAALTAAEQIDEHKQKAPLYFIISADEEIGMVGARVVANVSKTYREMVEGGTVAIVGEPTQFNVYYAHKGTLRISLRSHGKSAHSSSREGINANQKLFSILPDLERLRLQSESDPSLANSQFDPPTLSWNWVIRNEPFASNITPSLAELQIFLRPMPNVDHEQLANQIEQIAREADIEFHCGESNPPLDGNAESELVRRILKITRADVAKTACYATDGGVLQELSQIVVCGPGNIAQAHRNDEWIAIDQLQRGVDVFKAAFEQYCY